MVETDIRAHNLIAAVIIELLIFAPVIASAQLVMEAYVYQKIVESIHTVFNNTCVIFMYTVERPMQALDLKEAKQLMSIPLYIARLHVRTFAYAIKTFKKSEVLSVKDYQHINVVHLFPVVLEEVKIYYVRNAHISTRKDAPACRSVSMRGSKEVGEAYFTLKRPLFILINDSDDMRKQFAKDIAPWISMSYINWIIFFREETSIDDFFSNIYVPLDCIFLIVQKLKNSRIHMLTEVYRIANGRELLTNFFGSWNENDSLEITKLTLYQRRGNLLGQQIRVTSLEDPPVSKLKRDSSGKMMGIKGFFGTIIQILEENMNCTIVYTECDSWGSILPNGSWTGIVGMLVKNETDLAATELLMTSDRLKAVEFTTPVFSTKCRTFIKRPYYTAVKWTAYSDPFYAGIWISLLAIMLMSSALILISFKVSPSRVLYKKEELSSSFIDTLFNIFGALCGQGYNYDVIDPIRLISLVLHMTGVIILAAYSAALISFLAVKVFVMPFATMEGLLNDGSYKFGVVRDSADFSFFQNSSDKILQRMFEEILDDLEKLPKNYLEGLNFVCSKDKYAFMIMDNMFAILEHQLPCIVEPLDTIMQTTIAMAVPKRSPYRGIINTNILLMRDSGILQRVIATELVVQSAKLNDHWTSVEMVDILPLLLLILGGLLGGLLALFLEKIQYLQYGIRFKNFVIRKLLM